MEGKYTEASICLMISGMCDMFDGTVASTKQRNRREKRFGIQIDSLSDLICFGVLPALFVYSISGKNYMAFFVSGFYVLSALIRLAYFNVVEEERQEIEGGKRTWYLGLPVTAAAIFIPACYVIQSELDCTAVMQIALIMMAVAFVLPFKIKSHIWRGNRDFIYGNHRICYFIIRIGIRHMNRDTLLIRFYTTQFREGVFKNSGTATGVEESRSISQFPDFQVAYPFVCKEKPD